MTNDMTVGSPIKLIIRFIIPLLIGNIFHQIYSMVDTIIVGKYIGTEALAGVGLVGSINFFVLGFVMGLTSGFSVPISQKFGANDYSKMRHFVSVAIYLCIISTIIITILSVAFLKPVLILMQTPDDVFAYSYDYMVIILGGLFANVAYNMTASILRALGDSKTPLYFLIVAAFLNILLDLIFVIAFNMGVAGAGLATVISQGVSALCCVVYMIKKFKILKIQKNERSFDKKLASRLLLIGFPMAFQYSITAIGSIILQSAVNYLGTIYIASYTVCCKIEQLAIQPFITLGIASTTYVGQNLGAGKIDRIKDGIKKMSIIGIIIAILSGILIYFAQENLVKLFITEGDNLSNIIVYARQYLVWASSFFIPLMLLILYRGALQGMNEALIPLCMGITELLSRLIVASFVGIIGYLAICLACPVAWFSGCVIALWAYFKKIKRLKYANLR